MKKWAALTVLLYGITLLLLSAPLLLVGWWKWAAKMETHLTVGEAFSVYGQWGYWLWLAVMLGIQALLLLVPVRAAERRPISRRRLGVPIFTTAFLLANMFIGGFFSILFLLFKDDGAKPLLFLGNLMFQNPIFVDAFQKSGVVITEDMRSVIGLIGTIFALWVAWGLIFYRYARADDPGALTKRATHWLLRGSILELLVAVPSHVIVRNRGDCCAPFGTFWGITTGLSIMLLAFGPGVFFLFVERCQRLKPRTPPPIPPVIS